MQKQIYKTNKLINKTETDSQIENRLMVAKEEWEAWFGNLGLVDANYYIQNG